MTIVFWCLWRRRNEKVWEGIQKDPHVSVILARQAFLEWKSIRMTVSSPHAAGHPRQMQHCWTKPPHDFVKCNIDAAMFQDTCSFGIGLCLRDSTGSFIMAKTILHQGMPQVHEVEAMGLLDAVEWLREQQYHNIIMELDCKHVVDNIKSANSNFSEFGSIIIRCKEGLSFLQNHIVGFSRRQANHVAHTLARASQSYASHHVFHLIPTCIETILLNEMI